MRINEILTEPLTFVIRSRSHSHGQSDLTLAAYQGTECVGYINYSLWRGEVAVQMIEALRRGLGVGPAMVRELQKQYPATEIDFGMLTDDGAKLLAKLPTTYLPDSKYAEKADRLAHVKAELATLKDESEQHYQNPTEAGRAWFRQVGDHWNALHDEEWKLEQALHGMKPGRRFIKTD